MTHTQYEDPKSAIPQLAQDLRSISAAKRTLKPVRVMLPYPSIFVLVCSRAGDSAMECLRQIDVHFRSLHLGNAVMEQQDIGFVCFSMHS